MDCSLSGSSVRGILQARILEWAAFPPPGDLPDLVIEPVSPALADRFFTAEPPEEGFSYSTCVLIKLLFVPYDSAQLASLSAHHPWTSPNRFKSFLLVPILLTFICLLQHLSLP